MRWYGDVFNDRGQEAVILLFTYGIQTCSDEDCESEGIHMIPGSDKPYCIDHFQGKLGQIRKGWEP